jgi:hypothetical protein
MQSKSPTCLYFIDQSNSSKVKVIHWKKRILPIDQLLKSISHLLLSKFQIMRLVEVAMNMLYTKTASA